MLAVHTCLRGSRLWVAGGDLRGPRPAVAGHHAPSPAVRAARRPAEARIRAPRPVLPFS